MCRETPSILVFVELKAPGLKLTPAFMNHNSNTSSIANTIRHIIEREISIAGFK